MPTAREIRRERLKTDFEKMSDLSGTIIQWTPSSGEAPFLDGYNVSISVRSVIDDKPTYRDKHRFSIELGPEYPAVAPVARSLDQPVPYNPNFFQNGTWCYGRWLPTEFLTDYLIRMARTLQFDPAIVNRGSPANSLASQWYASKLASGIFPCDRQELPRIRKSRLRMKSQLRLRG